MLGTTNKASLMKGYNFYNFQEESTKVLRHLRGAEKLMEVLDVKKRLPGGDGFTFEFCSSFFKPTSNDIANSLTAGCEDS